MKKSQSKQSRHSSRLSNTQQKGHHEAVRMNGSMLDISELKQAQEALQQQHQITKTITDTASACLFMINHSGQVTFLNPAAVRVTGYTIDDALGKPMHSLVHHSRPDGAPYPETECPLVATYKHGAPNPPHEDIFFRKDGSPFPALITGTPIPGSGGIRGTVVEFRDLTEEKRSKEALVESEERFRIMADSIQSLAWMANPDGSIFWYNKRWYDYTGSTFEEMQGWGWQKVHHPDHIERVLDFVKKAWNKTEPWELTFPLKGQNGEYRWFLTRANPVLDKNGLVIRWIGTNTDIDDQRQAMERKDEFIGIASHELKTPVTSIKAYAQVLQHRFKKAGNMQSAEMAGKMDAQLNKLSSLIDDLLDVTKIESGKLQFNENYFDFNELVNEIIEQMQLTTKKHVIRKELAKNKSVYGDRDRLGQVIVNFISNAIKYSPQSDAILVKTTTDKVNITLSVQDFGVGIPKNMQNKVFERFYRVGEQETYPGLGLGLYISAEIIRRLGGKIWVSSEKKKGSIFSFSLPLIRQSTLVKSKKK